MALFSHAMATGNFHNMHALGGKKEGVARLDEIRKQEEWKEHEEWKRERERERKNG